MNRRSSHSHCSASSSSSTSSQGQARISRCVDCKKPLFTRTWTEKLKSQIWTKLQWPSKKRQDASGGRYIVKQRCGECQEPLRCSECSEAFFSNLSPDEIKVFIKAMVLFAMKGLCVDCNQAFRFVYDELFDSPCPASSGNLSAENEAPNEKVRNLDMEFEGAVSNPISLSEIEAAEEGSPTGKKSDGSERHEVMQWKGGVFLSDWKREMDELLGNRFHLVLER